MKAKKLIAAFMAMAISCGAAHTANYCTPGRFLASAEDESLLLLGGMYYDEDTMSEYDSDIYKIGSGMLLDSSSMINSNSHLDDDDENRIHKEYIMDYEIMSKEVNQYNSMESE